MTTKNIYVRDTARTPMPHICIAWDGKQLAMIQYEKVENENGIVYQPVIIDHDPKSALDYLVMAIMDGKHLSASDGGSSQKP